MPSSIPFHPALSLGSIVDTNLLDNLKAISALAGPADAAQDTLNSMIALKRSLEMTALELLNMDVDTTAIKAKIEEVKKSLSESAIQYANLRMESEVEAQSLRAQGQGITSAIESPVDFKQSKVDSLYIGSDSLKFDSQYFSFADRSQTINTMSKIKEFLTDGTASSGTAAPSPLVSGSLDRLGKQAATHQLQGTLIITATCTHGAARVLQPLVLDPEKLLNVWNRTYPDDRIDVASPQGLSNAALEPAAADGNALSLVSGATCGSSFVGMVHIVSNQNAGQSADQQSFVRQLESIEKQAALNAVAGHIGTDRNLGADAINSSDQNFQAHMTILTAGVIPEVSSTDMQAMAWGFKEIGAAEIETALSLASSDGSLPLSKKFKAQHGKEANSVASLHAYGVKTALTALADKDSKTNKNFDLESLLKAFDTYVRAITIKDLQRGEKPIPPGVPINFFLHPVTKADVARLLIDKLRSDKAAKSVKEEEDEDKRDYYR